MQETPEKSPSEPQKRPDHREQDESFTPKDGAFTLPSHVTALGTLDRLVETARD